MPVLVTKWFGAFLVEDGRVTKEARFPLTVPEIADRLERMRAGEVLPEEKSLAGRDVQVLEARLKSLGRQHEKAVFFALNVAEPDRRILHDASIQVARNEGRQAHGERDRFLSQSVGALEELDKTVNSLVERLREWYGLHYPEALERLTEPKQFVELLSQDPERGVLAPKINSTAAESLGVPFAPEELQAVKGLATTLRELYLERARLDRLITQTAQSIAPTLSALVGGMIAAKLIARAGGLEELAFLPAGTVQTLGAETSLFQHLKEGTKPPKHGVIFEHGIVNTAARWQRGRMSRVLAAHALLAARADHFKPGDTTRLEELRRRLDAAVTRVKKSKPPQARDDRPQRKSMPWRERKQQMAAQSRGPPGQGRGPGPRGPPPRGRR